MHHQVARTVPGRRLFDSWSQGLEVWGTVVRAVPDLEALCLMPDHLHLLARSDPRLRLAQALSGVARRRNAHEGCRGPLFERLPVPRPFDGYDKVQRQIRYVHLNPCRAGLVDDPLAWPLSTHRDALDLTWHRVGPRRSDALHAYVSADPSVHPLGTTLPQAPARRLQGEEVLAAVSCVLRVPVERLGRVPLARSTAWALVQRDETMTLRQLSQALGVSGRTLRRAVQVPRALEALARRVAADERFAGLSA
jgi:hypothetical protein